MSVLLDRIRNHLRKERNSDEGKTGMQSWSRSNTPQAECSVFRVLMLAALALSKPLRLGELAGITPAIYFFAQDSTLNLTSPAQNHPISKVSLIRCILANNASGVSASSIWSSASVFQDKYLPVL